MRFTRYLPLLLLPLLAFAGCGGFEPAEPTTPEPALEPFTPADHISVDHILIGVKNPKNPRGKYSLEDARKLAYDLLAQLNDGADWATLKKTHSEDSPPGGPYAMANHGVRLTIPGERKRIGMVDAFGDVGFTLRLDEIGIADFDPNKSPFGFHIIKRVK